MVVLGNGGAGDGPPGACRLALQAAQRAAMKEFPHPFAWAAFGLTGVGH
jgi:hypothetical protein